MENKKVGIGIGVLALVVILLTVILIFGLKGKTTYKVTFDLGNNGMNEIVEVDKNGAVSRPANPTKEGYTFEGWYYNGTKFDFSTKITKDITLTAKWEVIKEQDSEVTIKYTVKFDSKGGSSVKEQTVEQNKLAVKPANPTREGYTFEGWYYNGTKFDFSTKVTKDITLTAKWEVIKEQDSEVTIKYTVKFDSKGGSSVKTQTVVQNKLAVKPVAPTRPGYKFLGWYNGDVLYDFSTKVTKDITLTAKWEKIIAKYTVTFDSKGGTTVASQTIEEGKIVTKPADPSKNGHVFVGWYNGDVLYDFSSEVNSNITLTAHYAVVSYTIEDVSNSLYPQAKLYILKGDTPVRGTIKVTNQKNETITKIVEVSGLDILKGTYTYSDPQILD